MISKLHMSSYLTGMLQSISKEYNFVLMYYLNMLDFNKFNNLFKIQTGSLVTYFKNTLLGWTTISYYKHSGSFYRSRSGFNLTVLTRT